LATKVLPPEEQLEGLKTRLREVGAPAEVENRIDAIVAKQAEEGTAVADAREFCNSELDAIEGVYPGFRQGLHQKYTFFSCVTHDLERSLSRVRFALICQITASQENCLGQLTEDEKTWANDVLAAVEG
jgi:hypothetical protein